MKLDEVLIMSGIDAIKILKQLDLGKIENIELLQELKLILFNAELSRRKEKISKQIEFINSIACMTQDEFNSSNENILL